MFRTWLVGIAIGGILLGAGVPARSAEPSSSSPDDAEHLVSEGIRLRRLHQDIEALDLFQRAFRLEGSARTKAQVGLAEQALGRWIDAERHLNEALLAETDPWISRNRESLRQMLAVVSRHIGQLDIDANVEPAELFIAGERIGQLPIRGLRLVAEVAHLEVRSAGYAPVTLEAKIVAGETIHERVEFNTAVPVRAPGSTDRGADLAPQAQVAPQPGQTQRAVGWTLVGAGTILLIEGMASHIVHERLVSDYNQDTHCFSPSRDGACDQRVHDANVAQTLMTAGYVGAGLTLGTGITLLLTAPHARRSSASLSWSGNHQGFRIWCSTSF